MSSVFVNKFLKLFHTAFASIRPQKSIHTFFFISDLVNLQLHAFVAQITATRLEGLLYSTHVVVRILVGKVTIAALKGALDKAFFAGNGRVRRVPLDIWRWLPRRAAAVSNSHHIFVLGLDPFEGKCSLFNSVAQQVFDFVCFTRREVFGWQPFDHLFLLARNHQTNFALTALPDGRIGQSFRLFLLFLQ